MTVTVVFIKEQYFIDNASFVEMLDPHELIKQPTRSYLFINIKYYGNDFYIPFRKSIDLRIGNIGYSLPSSTRPNAGLDFRKALIVNDNSYIQLLPTINIESDEKVIK